MALPGKLAQELLGESRKVDLAAGTGARTCPAQRAALVIDLDHETGIEVPASLQSTCRTQAEACAAGGAQPVPKDRGYVLGGCYRHRQ